MLEKNPAAMAMKNPKEELGRKKTELPQVSGYPEEAPPMMLPGEIMKLVLKTRTPISQRTSPTEEVLGGVVASLDQAMDTNQRLITKKTNQVLIHLSWNPR